MYHSLRILNSIFLITMGCFLFWLAEGLIAKDESYFVSTAIFQALLSTPGVLIIALGVKEIINGD